MKRSLRTSPDLTSGVGAAVVATVLFLTAPQALARELRTPKRHEPDPITNGVSAHEDPAVVGVATDGIYCTGVVVASHVVLTAGHCADAPEPTRVFVGPSPIEDDPPGRWIDVAYAAHHPEYAAPGDEFDIGVLVLDEDAGVTPLRIADSDPAENLAGRRVRVVGYGATPPNENSSSHKHEGWSVVAESTETELVIGRDPSQPCRGDSGGPILLKLDGGERIVGIVSAGDPQCRIYARGVRPDRFWEEFIAAFVQDAPIGERCYYAQHCASGVCRTPPDTARRYCSRECRSQRDCPTEMICEVAAHGESVCGFEGASPGALGGDCTAHVDCESASCVPSSEGSMCGELCFPEDDAACPEGFDCVDVGLDGHSCVPVQTASSSATSSGTEPTASTAGGCKQSGRRGGPIAMLGFVASVYRRRRARLRRFRSIGSRRDGSSSERGRPNARPAWPARYHEVCNPSRYGDTESGDDLLRSHSGNAQRAWHCRIRRRGHR